MKCGIETCNRKVWAKELCSSHYARKWELDNPERHKKIYENGRRKNIIKIRARNLVATHIKRGKIEKQPCQICNNKKVHAHHYDYSLPLVITWLCPTHHEMLHFVTTR